jgi:NADPH:quinone reductase-like Zn-dependent oxidoreductase
MNVYELHAREGFDSLVKGERPSPRPGACEVKVRVRAVSLNFRDLNVAKRAKGDNRARPIVPASDGAGEVVDVGPGVTRLRVGDRVMAAFFPTWQRGELEESHHAHALGGGTSDGMLAQEVVLREDAWVRIPEHLSFEEASTLPCAGVTAYHALFVAAAVKPGDTVLLQGTGGVSILALQLAKAAGAIPLVTSSSAAKRERAKALGAVETFDYKATPAWGETVRAFTGGRGVDVAVEVGGPGTFDQSVAALRFGGTMSILGVLTGVRGEVNTHAIFHKGLKVHGVYVGSVAMFEDLGRALSASRIVPIVDRVFAFDEARAAYEYLASGAHFGKVVVRVD